MKPVHIDLFSGIGGFSIASHWAGFDTKLFCEIEPYPQSVLRHYWPDVPIHNDVNNLVMADYGIDHAALLTASIPCQPFSSAGKRKGVEDDRWLFPATQRVIREIRPTWVVIENVRGLITLGHEEVCAGLEEEGYTHETFVLPAIGINAPHYRQRSWIVARDGSSPYPDASGMESGRRPVCGERDTEREAFDARRDDSLPRSRQDSGSRTGNPSDASGVSAGEPHDQADTVAVGGEARQVSLRRSDLQEHDGREPEQRLGFTDDGVAKRLSEIRDLRDSTDSSGHLRRASRRVGPDSLDGSGGSRPSEWTGPEFGIRQPHDGVADYLSRPQPHFFDGDWNRGVARVVPKDKGTEQRLKALGNAIVPPVAFVLLNNIYTIEFGAI